MIELTPADRLEIVQLQSIFAWAVDRRERELFPLAFTADFEELVTRYCFGEAWSREGLTRAQRSMITIAMLVAMGRAPEVRVHVKGAINNGVSVEEIRELLIHSAIYCGVPAAVDGFRQASAVLQEAGLI